MSSFVECLVERGREPVLVWSSSSNHKYSFLMSPPLDWMLTLPSLWCSCSNGEFPLIIKTSCVRKKSMLNFVFLYIYSLSDKGNHIVIMSIHQPRYSIFKLLDTLTLLSAGNVVYHGQADNALEYFNGAGT